MVGVFACPECGEEVILEGLAPGRQTHCSACGTLVEVPYLPRVTPSGTGSRRFRSRKSRKLLKRAIAAGVAVVLIVAVGFSVVNLVRSRLGSAAKTRLNEVIASADTAERAARLDRALTEIEAAIRLADNPAASDGLGRDALRQRRDSLSQREAAGRLDQIAKLDPARAVGEALILRQRVKSDRALAALGSRVEQGLRDSRRRWFDQDMNSARISMDAGKPVDALTMARRAWTTSAELADAASRTRVELLVTEIVQAHGVIIEPVRGSFFLGSEEIYTKNILSPLQDALRMHAYIPAPPVAEWAELWRSQAPNRVTITIREMSEGLYLQSQNRSTRIECRVTLNRNRGPSWELVINARTGQGPILTNMRAYQAGHLGTSSKRNTDQERLLFEDAFKFLLEQFGLRIRALPDNLGPSSSVR